VERTYARQERPLTFHAQSISEWRAWQAALREKIEELAGLLPPPEACDLNARNVESSEMADGTVIREKVIYQSEPDVWVPAWLLRPKEARGRLPAVLAVHGHGGYWGKDQVAGVTDHYEQVAQNVERFNYDYGLQYARRGYVVLCPDARVFGERAAGYWAPDSPDVHHAPCHFAGTKAALLGYSLLALTVWDDRRGIDYLQSRADVAGDRIGVVGLSLGGTRTTFIAALDDRVAAAVISGYSNTYYRYALQRGFCGGQFVHGLLRWAELPDVMALIAPRPLLIEAGLQDKGFPIEGSREAHQTLERAYALHDAGDRLWRDEFDAGHQWSGRLAYDFMERYLRA
jgi:dienelactone hydrolase